MPKTVVQSDPAWYYFCKM